MGTDGTDEDLSLIHISTEGKLDRAVVVVEQLNQRVERLELRVAPRALVTEDQASQISQAVKAVAIDLGQKSGRNEFGGIYGELYRKYGVTGYKQLPAAKFQEAMHWLNEWRDNIEGIQSF